LILAIYIQTVFPLVNTYGIKQKNISVTEVVYKTEKEDKSNLYMIIVTDLSLSVTSISCFLRDVNEMGTLL